MGSLNDLSLTTFNPLDRNSLKSHLQQTIDLILDYYKSLETLPILPNLEPSYLSHHLPSSPPADPSSFASTLETLRHSILPGLTHWQSPNFFAYFPATLSSAAIAGDLLASAVNNVGFSWVASPAAVRWRGWWWIGWLRCWGCRRSSGLRVGVVE